MHKAQGSTLDGAVIGLGKKKIDHLHYVALSRVQKLSNVHLLNFDESTIKVSDFVVEEMNRLRTTANVFVTIPLLYNIAGNVLKIIFHNCRSFKKHFQDIKKDYNLLSADIFAFAESCLSARDSNSRYELEGFEISRNDDHCCNERPYHGTIVYSKIMPNLFQKRNIFNIELTQGYILHGDSQINVCFVYCPPKLASMSLYKTFFCIFR